MQEALSFSFSFSFSLSLFLSFSFSFSPLLLLSPSLSFSLSLFLLDAECRAPIGVTSEAPQHCCENYCHKIRYCDYCPRKHSPSWQYRATSAKTSCYEPRTSRLGVLVFCPSVSCSRVWGVSPLPQILHQKILRDRIRNPTEFHCLQDSPNLRCQRSAARRFAVALVHVGPNPPRRSLPGSEALAYRQSARQYDARRFAVALVHVGRPASTISSRI